MSSSNFLSGKTVKQLREIARRKKITGYSTLRKDELITCISSNVSKCKSTKKTPECQNIVATKTRNVKGITKYYVRCDGKKRYRATDIVTYNSLLQKPAFIKDEPLELLTGSRLKVTATTKTHPLVLAFRERYRK